MSPPPVDTRKVDLAALAQFWRAALLAVVGSVLGIAVPLVLSNTGYFTFDIPTAGSAFHVDQTSLAVVLGVASVGLVISMVSFWMYREGFLSVRSVDAKFSSSPTWALLVIVGLVLFIVGLVTLLEAILQLLSCTGGSTTSIPTSCLNLGPLLGAAGLLLVAAIVLLIGYIGTLVAIWRLGDRYDDPLYKVGAVLLIIPYISFVGQVLVLVATSRAKTKVEQHPPFAVAPSYPSWPPPPR